MLPLPTVPNAIGDHPNKQPRSARAHGDGTTLEVVKVFYTIQGEGPFSGTPAIFVRLGGCNLQCPVCDTDYTTGVISVTVDKLVNTIGVLAGHKDFLPLVVLTGGEPCRQNLTFLLAVLWEKGYLVQLETNGTYSTREYMHFPNLSIVVSPKTVHSHPELEGHYWKYVMEGALASEYDGLPKSTLGAHVPPARPPEGTPRSRIYLQPADYGDEEVNKLSLETCLESCLCYGYRLGVQVHKYLGLE